MFNFYEFFAGGGMARAGLGPDWTCLFANDFDPKKGATYQRNWGKGAMVVDDLRNIAPNDLPNTADLVWGSFPCQDLSVAGNGAGLKGPRSGTFWPFMALLTELKNEGRAPSMITLENVVGTLTSGQGADFVAICSALKGLGYKFGAVVVDAALFLPQSRARLFVVAVREDLVVTGTTDGPQKRWHTPALKRAYDQLPKKLKTSWVWWDMPTPAKREMRFADVIEEKPKSVKWHTAVETRALLSMMSDVNLAKVETAKASGVRMVGGLYKRTRLHHGIKVQRAEVRFDDIAGCLRTPGGGSSRQLILVVEGEKIRSRLLSARETARLMGLPDSYILPAVYNEAYHLTGDGVAVPVVSYISKHILEPNLQLQFNNVASAKRAAKNPG
jgi:DNA (cytosine-5)-methyltransferase 1